MGYIVRPCLKKTKELENDERERDLSWKSKEWNLQKKEID
jgi:hypothetical protein